MENKLKKGTNTSSLPVQNSGGKFKVSIIKNLPDNFSSEVITVYSAVFHGVDAVNVEIQISVLKGLPSISIIGLPDAAIKEAKDRVRSALESSGFSIPLRNLVINLAPASLRKVGTQLDLPIALAILLTSAQISCGKDHKLFAAGELSLNGRIRSFRGIVPLFLSMPSLTGDIKIFPKIKNILVNNFFKENDFNKNHPENRVNPYPRIGERVIQTDNLKELIFELEKNTTSKPDSPFIKNAEAKNDSLKKNQDLYDPQKIKIYREVYLKNWIDQNGCFSDVFGQESAKRVLEIAAIGLHNVILIGPPGCGKTMLVKRFPGILPPLTEKEILEVSRIHSLQSDEPFGKIFSGIPPFRAPHHTSTEFTLLGGGLYPKMGEITLAHNGILFLDEFTEYKNQTLQALREPLEDGSHTVQRNGISYHFPSRFQLVAAANPCRCGYFLDPVYNCSCTGQTIRAHVSRINGPLIDRIDLEVEIPRPDSIKLNYDKKGIGKSLDIQERVLEGRIFSQERLREGGVNKFIPNSRMSKKMQKKFLRLKPGLSDFAENLFKKKSLSLRSLDKVIIVSRTIADLEKSQWVDESHLLEAISYKKVTNKYAECLS